MIWVRSIFFFCGMAASAVLFCPIALIVWPVPAVARMRIIGLWARFIGWWLAVGRLACGPVSGDSTPCATNDIG